MSANSRKVSPLAWVPTLYFAMGLPFIIVNMVATLMFRGLGIDDARITLWTSLIILPWSLKPFWSPLMEMFRTKKFWVVTTQLLFRKDHHRPPEHHILLSQQLPIPQSRNGLPASPINRRCCHGLHEFVHHQQTQ